jgi:hypothetical protein
MAFVANAVSSVAKAVGSAVGTVVHSVGDAVGKAATAVANAAAPVLGKVLSVAGTVAETLGVPAGVVNTVEGVLGIPQSTTPSGVLGAIAGGINSLTGGALTSASNVVNSVTQTISGLTGSTQGSLDNVVSGITNLLGNTFQPLSKLVDQFASQPALQALNTKVQIDGQSKIANEIFKPAFENSIQDPLTKIHATIDTYSKLPKTALKDPPKVNLGPSADIKDTYDELTQLVIRYKEEGGLVGTVMGMGFDIAKVIGLIPAFLEGSIDEAKQFSRSLSQGERLDISSAVQAYMKGIISGDQFNQELKAYGLNEQRAQVLFELASPFLSANEAIRSFQLGIITDQALLDELEKQGYETSHIQALRELASYLPNASDAVNLFYRGLIDEDAFNRILRGNGYSAQDIKLAKDSAVSPLSPQGYGGILDRVTARDKGFMAKSYAQEPPKNLTEVYKENRLTLQQAEIDWLAHWKDLPPNEWISAHFRGFISEEQMRLALSSQSIPVEAVDLLMQLQRPQLSIRYVTELLETGGLTKEEATAYLYTQGYDETTTKLILKYIESKVYGHLAETTNSLFQLSIGQLEQMFTDKVIDAEQFKQGLIAHKYTPEASDLLVHLREVQNELVHRKEQASDIVAEFRLGLIDIDKAVSLLHNAGFSQGEVDKYQSEMVRAKALNSKLPNEGILNGLLKKGLIGEELYIKQLVTLGYSTLWASLIYELESGKAVEDAALRNTIREVTGIDEEGGDAPKSSASTVSKELGTPVDQGPIIKN